MGVGLSGWVGDKVGEAGLGCESEDWGSASIAVRLETSCILVTRPFKIHGLWAKLTVSPRSCAHVQEEDF